MDSLKAYYWLTKPGIVYGNLLAVGAGFFIASHKHIDLTLLVWTAVSIALVIASACAFNNYIDRDIDKRMKRTSWRALAKGEISGRSALIFAALLGLAGFTVLGVFCNGLTFVVGVIAFIDYVVFYGWSKRHTWHGTLVGSVSGSAPLVAGYTSATGRFDAGALLLFILMCSWQMPHFYAIAIRRLTDYKRAGIPVLPAVKGIRATKLQIMVYVAAFTVSGLLLYLTDYGGVVYAVFICLYAAGWLVLGAKGFNTSSDRQWAKNMFLYSLLFLPCLFAVTFVDVWL